MRKCAICIVFLASLWAYEGGFDKEAVVMTYHKLTGEPLDYQAIAEQSEAVRRVSNFDKPDAVKAEIARLQAEVAGTNPDREFVIRVDDSISEYDHDHGEFSIYLFRPGYFVPVDLFRQQYQLVFANAESMRAIPMAKDDARVFDAQLNRTGRRVLNEIRFRVVGKGDPAGAVTGLKVIRAEILSARLLDESGRVVFTPQVTGKAAASAPAVDLGKADIAGFHIGVKASEMEASLTRLFGPVRRGKGSLTVNEMGCFSVPGRKNPKPGAVCVTALFDGDEMVRSIRMERVFSWLDAEVYRKALTQKYGPVAAARNVGSTFSLGWGPEVKPEVLYDRSGPANALTAFYVTNDDFMSRGLNSLPQIRIVLQLVDAKWASGGKLQ